ncbi:odorant receptor 67a-like [Drosophila elegans]|uniref:odorant receptor 67a-like n=1 Tax=Drosophila elegans TaxID=30023 RepID=UPI0007E5F040|nr:odorant receptor 67a-like [Drosophila elegans]
MANFIKENILAVRTKYQRKPNTGYPVVEDFLRPAVVFFHSVGVDPYESDNKPGLGLHIYFAFHITNLFFVWGSSIVFVVNSVRTNNINDFLGTCMVVGYITFGNVGILKIFAVKTYRQGMTSLVHRLKSLFPPPNEKEQELFGVRRHLKRCILVSKGFGFLLVVMAINTSLSPFAQYAIQRWWLHLPNPMQTLPFVSMAPWDWRDTWRFYPTYLLQCIAAYSATCGYISTDLMMFAVALQAIMHFDKLARDLREFNTQRHRDGRGSDKALKELSSLIAYHIQILGLVSAMNDVFGIPLLLNFLNSSLLVCNVGFQLTMGFSLEQVLIITSALVEIYLVCFFSQMLIDASNNVGFAIYDMNWMEAKPRFRKMLIFLSMRAQKPVCLKATVFFGVSIQTMSIFLQVSYKFFCAIQMMYR